MKTLHIETNLIRSWTRVLIVAAAFTGFAVVPIARGITPAPDGGYSGNNTAEGTDALFSLAGGAGNTAIGFDVLYHNTIGFSNTGIGTNALHENTTAGSNTAIGDAALYSNTTGQVNTATG